MKVGVLCEESGVVRDAFAARGHDAWSCDILPRQGKHIRGDCLAQDWSGFDLLICFPPCTHLCVSGARWFAEKRRKGHQQAAVEFFMGVVRIAESVPASSIEQPVGIMSKLYRRPDQIIQLWQYGHGETKATCLWLRGLPLLRPTNVVSGRESRVHRMSPGRNRAKPGASSLGHLPRNRRRYGGAVGQSRSQQVSTKLIARLDELMERATKGPHVRDPYSGTDMQIVAVGNEVVLYHRQHNRQVDERVVANIELFAFLRNQALHYRACMKEVEAWRNSPYQVQCARAATDAAALACGAGGGGEGG